MDAKEFTFLGFLPLNKKNRKEKLEEIKKQEHTTILYEAPHKLLQTLNELQEILENRKLVLARELTKIHEEYVEGTVEEVKNKIQTPKGEYVILIEKNKITEAQKQKDIRNMLTLEEHYQYYQNPGLNKKEIMKEIAKDRNVNKNEIYQYFIGK